MELDHLTAFVLQIALEKTVLKVSYLKIKTSNKVSHCKLKKDLFGNRAKEFRYSMAIANSPLVA